MSGTEDLQEHITAFRQLEADIQNSRNKAGQYQAQLHENEAVLKELQLLEDGANVFKLVGPLMVKQELEEARGNVAKRLEFIAQEQVRSEETVKTKEEQRDAARDVIIAKQQALQKAQAAAQ